MKKRKARRKLKRIFRKSTPKSSSLYKPLATDYKLWYATYVHRCDSANLKDGQQTSCYKIVLPFTVLESTTVNGEIIGVNQVASYLSCCKCNKKIDPSPEHPFKDVRANCFCASLLRTQMRLPRHT